MYSLSSTLTRGKNKRKKKKMGSFLAFFCFSVKKEKTVIARLAQFRWVNW